MQLSLLRADLLHPQVAGPKYIRLAAWLAMAKAQGYSKVVSAGGMHSNHLHALAMLAPKFGLAAEAYVRGLAHAKPSPLLAEAQAAGMVLHPLAKADYASLLLDTATPTLALPPDALFIPMGGDGSVGQAALDVWAAQLWSQLAAGTQLALTAGTGSTLQAFAATLPPQSRLWVAAPFKDASFLWNRVPAPYRNQITLWPSRMRFGKTDELATLYGRLFVEETGVRVDNLYMPHLMASLAQARLRAELPLGTPWALLHCGGQSANILAG